jgi:hypothetical protein
LHRRKAPHMIATVARRMMLIGGIAALVGGSSARGDYNLPTFFVADPQHNSQEWTSAIASENGLINTDVNFRSVTPGFLNASFYNSAAHADGVTLIASDSSIDNVVNNLGPDQTGNQGPTSTGEGTFAGGSYLQSTSPASNGSSLTIKFSTPVLAVGLSTIDYFGSDTMLYGGKPTNVLTLTVYDVSGNPLGSATGARDNFQPDNIYFMGFAATSDIIGSAVFSRSSDADGDTIGISGIAFATGGGLHPIPEPSSLALLAAGATALVIRTRRRHRPAA